MLLLPAFVARLTHIPLTVVFKFGVVLLEAAIAVTCVRLLRRIESAISRETLWALAFGFIAVFAVMPARDFGQRDHLLALLCLPYLLAAVLAAHPGQTARPSTLVLWLLGIATGLGLCLKPHHLLIFIAIELALVLKRRSPRTLFRPEPWAILLTGLVYLAAVRHLTPTYLSGIVPLLRDVYWAIGSLTIRQLIGESLQLHILAAIALALFFVVRSLKTSASLSVFTSTSASLLLAGIASTVAYYLQGTGWYYQQIPALSFFTLALWVELIELATLHKLSAPAWLPKAAAALALLALALTTHFMDYPFTAARSFPIDTPDPTFFAGLPPETPIAILTTTVDHSIPPLFRFHLAWALRTNNLWALPALLRDEDPQGIPPRHLIPATRLAELDRIEHAWMVEDLNRSQPQLLLIERCQDPAIRCQILEDRHDDLLAWFQRDPVFRAVFARYRPLRSSRACDAYVLAARGAY